MYVYDASGNRVLRRTTNSSGTTMTVYAFGLEEHSYFNTGGHKGDLYYYSLGGRLLGALDNTGKTTFYLSDALGSVLASFSNAAGIAAIKGNQVFGPYGNARDFQGTINTAKGFTGQYNDSLTGLDYYGSRYYDQVAGVFLSADTVHGNSSGANPYAYVGGNPETLADPSGQMPCAGPGGPCGWPSRPSGGNTGGGTSGSSMVQPVNAVLSTSTAAQGGSQPCLQIGCVSVLRAKVGFQATVNHFMSVNLPTMVCDPYCFITMGDGQTIGTSTVYGATEAPVTHCGVSPFACSDQHAKDGGDMGVNGHDMPDVAAADTGGEPGNAGEIDSSSQGESGDLAVLPQNAKFAQKTYSARFSMQGIFNGRPITEIAQDLANGTLQPEDIPVQYINRGDSTFILNTRSTVALIVAGIDRSTWIAEDVTGNALLEKLLNGQLVRNNLTNVGVDSVIGPLGWISLP